jgi:hypothetical protein
VLVRESRGLALAGQAGAAMSLRAEAVSVEGGRALLTRPLAMSTEPSAEPRRASDLGTRLSPETISAMPVQERLVKLNWIGEHVAQRRRARRIWRPTSSAARARRVCLVDVRDADELTGPQGHIPGSQWVPLERLRSCRTATRRARRSC